MLKKNEAFIAREKWRKALNSQKYNQITDEYGPIKCRKALNSQKYNQITDECRKALNSQKYNQITDEYGPIKCEYYIDFTINNDRCMIGVALDIFGLNPDDPCNLHALSLITKFSVEQLEAFIQMNDDEGLSFRKLAKKVVTTKPELE